MSKGRVPSLFGGSARRQRCEVGRRGIEPLYVGFDVYPRGTSRKAFTGCHGEEQGRPTHSENRRVYAMRWETATERWSTREQDEGNAGYKLTANSYTVRKGVRVRD